ncbi:hypothetical protein D3C77_738680 [compost metagenome]
MRRVESRLSYARILLGRKVIALGWLILGQAVDIGRQQVDFVIALNGFLCRHLPLATITNGLLQLGKT